MVARIKGYRASDDIETSLRYAEGHRKVLEAYGIKQVTSAVHNWLEDPNTYVLIVESEDGSKIYGGTRVQVRSPNLKLPMGDAIAKIDKKIYSYVDAIGDYNVAEFCGLFNSREVAGYGIGSLYLCRIAMAVSGLVGIKNLLALCSPITLLMSERIGFEILKDLGNNGTFYYPKLDLLATTMIYTDLKDLSTATEADRTAILSLRDNLSIIRTETLRRKEIIIHYDLEIPYLERWSLEETIENLVRSDYKNRTKPGTHNMRDLNIQ